MRSNKGFTLIELMIVVVIIGPLADVRGRCWRQGLPSPPASDGTRQL